MWRILLAIIVCCAAIIQTSANVASPKSVECECFNSTHTNSQDVCKDNVVKCSDSDRPSSCFVLWTTDNVTGESKVHLKGCFTDASCSNTECVETSAGKKMNFCCCIGHMCNSNFKYMPTTTKAPRQGTIENPPKPEEINLLLIVGIVCGVAFVVVILFGIAFFYRNKKNAMFNEIPTNEPDMNGSNLMIAAHRPIQLMELKARGRFGAVWRAQLKPDEVAVKIFPIQDKDSWVTEQNIFNLPRMKHPNILEFIGIEKHLDQSEYWLITAYHSYGSLCDYLKAHTVTWSELCKISESMARGLMHLHEEIPASKTDGLKPAVAHRDFKSKNVLLKSDLTACIADFGLALVFKPDVPCGDTHGQVGTRRYMAPEVLEGAINFTRDAFLRIDVYACALVLWELVSRCTAHGGPVPEYTLPFESELGLHPTLDAMQEHIVTNKLRPSIAEHWRDHTGLNAMCITLEECWDHDAEARLTASCVIERISQHTRYTKTELLIETNTDTPTKDIA